MDLDNSALEAHILDYDDKQANRITNPLLCKQCQPWNNLWEFKPQRGAYSNLRGLIYNKDCVICQAILKSINSRLKESESLEQWPITRIFVRNDGPFFLDTGYYPAYHPSRVDLTDTTKTAIRLVMNLHVSMLLEDQRSPDDINSAASSIIMTPQFCLYYSTGVAPQLASIEPWEVPFFDISLLRKWLQGCENVHGGRCLWDGYRLITDLPPGFRVIDVCSMQVVKPTKAVRFVAFSYMWQQSGGESHIQLESRNIKNLELPGGMASISLPNIISDAISLCKDLGETYLWVDRFCIIQDDAESKHDQIHGMDKIYRSAIFTIVAALNKRNNQGIPGFSGRPRISSVWRPPYDCEVEGRGIRPNCTTAIVNSSLWNKRGWTFQERVLSTRRLFITEFQVTFTCGKGEATEELAYCPQRPYNGGDSTAVTDLELDMEKEIEQREYREIPTFTRRSSNDKSMEYNIKSSISLIDYFALVEDYTTRQLSFGSDILNAFAGIGKSLGESFGSGMIFGLPEKYMPQALMWSCLGLVETRVDTPWIPSWSWASSVKHADYYWINQGRRFSGQDLVEIASLVYFHFQDPELGLRRLAIQERWIYYLVSIEDLATKDELPSLEGKYNPGVKRSTNTWKECPHSPWTMLNRTTLDPDTCSIATNFPGSLIFNTTVASLKLDHDTRDIYGLVDFPERDVAICDSKGGLVGWLNKMNLDWIDAHKGDDKTFEFIVLSGALADWRSRKTMAQYLRDFDMWQLNVMLIERLPFRPFVARRVDVGHIFAHRWKDCNPRWETVVLC